MKVPPFIATLGMMMLLKGLSLVISGTRPIYFNDTPGFTSIAQDSLIGNLIPALPIPNAVLILFLVAIGASIVLNRTIFGRYVRARQQRGSAAAVGRERRCVEDRGLHVQRRGVRDRRAADRVAAEFRAAGARAGLRADAIAAVVIGGTSLSGGAGSIVGTIIGAFIMSVLTNGLRIMSVAQEWQTVVTGVIIILAVYVDILRRRRR